MRRTRMIWSAAAVALALGACGGEVCECETPEGAPAEVSADGRSCESLAGEGTPYLFCYSRDQSFATGPSSRVPVAALIATLDSLAGDTPGPTLPDPRGVRR